jgi:hypothetical protein
MLFLDLFMREFSAQRWVFDVKIETAQVVLASLRQLLNSMPDGSALEKNITFLLWSKEDEVLAHRLFPSSQFFARDSECWRAGLAVIVGLSFFGDIKENRSYAVPPKLWGLSLFKARIFKSFQRRKAKVIAYLPTCNEDALAATKAGADLILSDRLFLNQ